jgi:hypothetical protein
MQGVTKIINGDSNLYTGLYFIGLMVKFMQSEMLNIISS